MKKAVITADKAYKISEVDRRLMGSFVEHLGRTVYGGIYEPGHPTADENGFRGDVKELIRELGVSIIRYPGGNFVSGYDWKDGIGPKAERPAKFDPAWKRVETNEVGTDEFVKYAKDTGFEVMMATNMGTGTPQDAQEFLDYCNGNGDTYWSGLRVKNGSEKPYGIKTWCLGNEMDGPWQICCMDADAYAKKAMEAAKLMRWTDPSIETVFCGSCATEPEHKTFGFWDRMVFERAYEQIDYISLHRYYNYTPAANMFYPLLDTFDDIPHFFTDLQDFLDMAKGAADYVKVATHSNKTINISFDEWGVITSDRAGGTEEFSAFKARGYSAFTQVDTMIYGGILCTFLNNADRVKIANQSLIVNNGGMISTKEGGGVIKQGTFYPFMHVAKYGKGIAIRTVVDGPSIETEHYGAHPAIVNAVVYNPETKEVTVFAINCSMEDDIEASIDLRSFGELVPVERIEIYNEDPFVRNTFETPDVIAPVTLPLDAPENGISKAVLKKHSWNVFRFKAE